MKIYFPIQTGEKLMTLVRSVIDQRFWWISLASFQIFKNPKTEIKLNKDARKWYFSKLKTKFRPSLILRSLLEQLTRFETDDILTFI